MAVNLYWSGAPVALRSPSSAPCNLCCGLWSRRQRGGGCVTCSPSLGVVRQAMPGTGSVAALVTRTNRGPVRAGLIRLCVHSVPAQPFHIVCCYVCWPLFQHVRAAGLRSSVFAETRCLLLTFQGDAWRLQQCQGSPPYCRL